MYQYPIQPDWSTEEIVDVVKFFEKVEAAYEQGIEREKLMSSYRRFKEIVPSIAEEKRLGREFEEASGYSLYRVIKKGKEASAGEIIKLGNR